MTVVADVPCSCLNI